MDLHLPFVYSQQVNSILTIYEDDEDKKIRNAFMTVSSTDGMDDQLTFDPNWSDLEIPPHLRRKPKDIPGVTREKRKPGPQPKTYHSYNFLENAWEK
jgi:hypothetical protein